MFPKLFLVISGVFIQLSVLTSFSMDTLVPYVVRIHETIWVSTPVKMEHTSWLNVTGMFTVSKNVDFNSMSMWNSDIILN